MTDILFEYDRRQKADYHSQCRDGARKTARYQTIEVEFTDMSRAGDKDPFDSMEELE